MKTTTKKISAKPLVKHTNSHITEKTKEFDSVKMMRDIRDKLSKEIMDMTFEEENVYLQNLLAKKTA